MKKLRIIILLLLLINNAKADLFTLHVEQGSINETRSFKSILDLFDKYENGELDTIINGYDKMAPASGSINFRGIMMYLDFDSSNNLTFKVPNIDIDMTFNSIDGTQESSFDALTDYLKANQDDLLKKILNATVSETPYDLVAGNPNSMMSMMVNSSYNISQNNLYGAMVSYLSPNASKHNFSFQGEDVSATILSLPLGYSFNFGDSGWALIFDMPLTYMDIDGSVSYAAQLGMSLNIPLTSYWNVILSGRAGAIGSEDMLSGGALFGGSIASNLKIPVGNWEFGMTNLAGIIKDFSLKVADYEIEYDLQNYAFKNGLSVAYNFTDKYSTMLEYNYTFYTGDDLFIDKYNEITFYLTRLFEKGSFVEGISLVGNYTFDGDIYKAYKVGFNILF